MRPQNEWNPFSVPQWVAWMSATAVAAITLVVFLYQNFATKADVEKRLERIENKLDELILRDEK